MIESMDLSLRAYNCLKRAGINTVDELINFYISNHMTLQTIRMMGETTEREILEKLADLGNCKVAQIAKAGVNK